MKNPGIDITSDYFGATMNCAIRYCLGRQTYMPKLVITEITPMLSYLSLKTIWCMERDVGEYLRQPYSGASDIYESWEKFYKEIRKVMEDKRE